jgi:thiol-disulfide isomerase/thioredoxin
MAGGEKTGKDLYAIKIKINGIKDTTCMLAYYYGDKKYIRDTVKVDSKGNCVFKSDTIIPGGVYLAVLPNKTYFEFLITNERQFSLETDTSNFIEKMKVGNSPENKAFYEYQLYIGTRYKEANDLKANLKKLKGNKDSTEIINKRLKAINEEVTSYKDNLINNNSGLFYSKVLKAMSDPQIPPTPILANGRPDSTFPYRYYKDHYWDNIDFSDDRLLRTPVFHSKLVQYFDRMVVKHPDSINIATDHLIEKARANKEVFKYCLVHLLNEYANSKIMGMDAVYVHIAEKYYGGGEAYWVDQTLLFKITDRAKTLKPLLIGKTAPNLMLKDTSGKYQSLYSVKSPYTLLVFWDPDCGHCKKAMPHVIEAYHKFKDKGFQVYAICTETEKDKWIKYINEQQLSWMNVADIELHSDFRTVYDINSTPKLFLLNDKKEIMAKQMGAEQLSEILDGFINKKAKNLGEIRIENKDESPTEEHQQ